MNTPEESKRPDSKEPKKKKGFRLFKRDDAGRLMDPEEPGYRDRYFYFQFQYRGKRYPRCLETNNAEKAQEKARKIAAEIKSAVQADSMARIDATKLRQPVAAKVSELIDAYNTSAVDANADTRLQNIQALLLVLKRVHGTENPRELSATTINGSTVRRWFELAKQRAEAEADQSIQLNIKHTANSRMAQARSLFTAKAMPSYIDAGIALPSFTDFEKAFATFKFSRLPESNYNPPDDKIIAATLESWEALTDRNLFLAVGHALAFGLRKGEISQARWTWWTQRSGYPVLDGTATVKNNSGLVQVRALDPFYTTMRTRIAIEKWRGEPNDYILTGPDSFRDDTIYRSVGHWMRNLGWETEKTIHTIRAYCGSQIAMKYGIYEAQTWLRHSTVKVTEDHYSHYIKRFKPQDPESLPIRWAIYNESPQLRILPSAVNE